MQPRIAYTKVVPGAMKTMRGLEDYRAECGLEPSLLDLVRTRASQNSVCTNSLPAARPRSLLSGSGQLRHGPRL